MHKRDQSNLAGSQRQEYNKKMKTFLNWEPLQKKDLVHIIAPASASTEEKLKAGLSWLESLQFDIIYSDNLMMPDLFFSAPLEEQCEDIKNALDSEAKVIWCLRGGWGSMRLLPFLETLSPPQNPKLLIGFSDITSLHLFFAQKWNWPTLHGRTISQLGLTWADSNEELLWKKVISGELAQIEFENLTPLNSAARTMKTIESTVTGGNLRLVQSSLGTPWQIDVKDKILFLEDVSERGYSVDRMFEQMLQSGLLIDGPAAVIFGSFTNGLEKNGVDLVPQAIERFAQRVSYPVLSGLPCGHDTKQNYPLPFNTQAHLILGENNKLICQTGVGLVRG